MSIEKTNFLDVLHTVVKRPYRGRSGPCGPSCPQTR